MALYAGRQTHMQIHVSQGHDGTLPFLGYKGPNVINFSSVFCLVPYGEFNIEFCYWQVGHL